MMGTRPFAHGYSTGLDRRFYGETVTLISTREIQDSERKSTQSKHSVRNDDTNRSRTAAMGGDTIQTRRDKCTEARRRLCKRRRSSGFGWLRRTCYLPLISPPGIPAYELCSSGQVTMCPRALASRCRCPPSQQQHAVGGNATTSAEVHGIPGAGCAPTAASAASAAAAARRW